jgi:hypothetical protein
MSVFCLIDVSMNYIEPCRMSRHAPGKTGIPLVFRTFYFSDFSPAGRVGWLNLLNLCYTES